MGIYDKGQDIEELNNELANKEIKETNGNLTNPLSSLWEHTSNTMFSDSPMHADKVLKGKLNGTSFDASSTGNKLFNILGMPEKLMRSKSIIHFIGNPFIAGERWKQGITGLYNYNTPTEEEFEKCNEVGGLSVWNSSGWWRCLFPNNTVEKNFEFFNIKETMDDSILTRENIEADVDHKKYGLFFKELTDYFTWRSHMNKMKKMNEFEKKKTYSMPNINEDLLFTTPEKLMAEDEYNFNLKKDKIIIGQSTFVTFNTNQDGKQKIKEYKTYYDDGTVAIRSEKTVTPSDGGKLINEVTENIISVDDDK